jgi:hypothetical protein
MSEISLATIESQAKAYSQERIRLASLVTILNAQLEAIKRKALPAIKRAVAAAAEERSKLGALVDTSHHLFVKPKTVVFHGIKVGLRKGSGGIDWEDDAKVVALIKKHFSKTEAELLIKTTEKPIAKSLSGLDVADLKKLGCTVEDTGDVVVITAVDGEVDKIVNALLKDATEETAPEQEAA